MYLPISKMVAQPHFRAEALLAVERRADKSLLPALLSAFEAVENRQQTVSEAERAGVHGPQP